MCLLLILPTIHVIMQMFMLQLGHHDTVIALFCPLYMVATFIINVTAYNKNGSEYMNIPSPFFNGHCIDKHIIAIPFSFRLPTIQAVCVCACAHITHTRTHIHIIIYTHMHTCTHTHAHTYAYPPIHPPTSTHAQFKRIVAMHDNSV